MVTTKEKLLQAAKTLLYEDGFEAMSPAKVLKLSGAGQGSLYHHFSGKKDLALTVLDGVGDEMIEVAESVFNDAELSPIQKLESFFGKQRNGLLGCKLGRLANEKAFRDSDLRAPLDKYFSTILAHVKRTLNEAVSQNCYRSDLPIDDVAQLLVACVQGGSVISRSLNDNARVNFATQGALALLRSIMIEEKSP